MRRWRNAQPGNRLHVVHPQPILAIIVWNHQSYDHLTIALSKGPFKNERKSSISRLFAACFKIISLSRRPVPWFSSARRVPFQWKVVLAICRQLWYHSWWLSFLVFDTLYYTGFPKRKPFSLQYCIIHQKTINVTQKHGFIMAMGVEFPKFRHILTYP